MFACGFTKGEYTAEEKSLDNVRNNGKISIPIIEKLNNISEKINLLKICYNNDR
jgi:hypothetical protein